MASTLSHPHSHLVSHLVISRADPLQQEVAFALLAAQLSEHDIAVGEGPLRAAVAGLLDPEQGPRRGTILLGWIDGRAVAVACMSYVWTVERGGEVVWLDELYVVPEHRGAGIGQTLLRAALDHARQASCLTMELEVEDSHARAGHLYVREEFVRLPRTRYVRDLRGATTGTTG